MFLRLYAKGLYAKRSLAAITLLTSALISSQTAFAGDGDLGFAGSGGFGGFAYFLPGNLIVSRVVYDNNPKNVQVGQPLPPNCTGSNCVAATANGAYPFVWNNALADGSFGITATIFLDQVDLGGRFINSLEVPNGRQRQHGFGPAGDSMVGSFSSKSEDALNLSTDGRFVTLMGYLAPVDAIDISNSNTPGVVDPTNPVPAQNFRIVAQVDALGRFRFTKTNAYSGNNGRAAILNDSGRIPLIYTAGNAGNGSNPQPNGVILGAGAQILDASREPEASQAPGQPTPVGSFSVTQLGLKADKVGKDTNFRGLTVFDNVVYLTKGSGGNGVNTVYFIDTSGFDGNGKPLACPNGTGVPRAAAGLPTAPISFNAANLQSQGVTPYNMCVLQGFPTNSAKSATLFPFGLWFANAKTLYVADEGNGTATFSGGRFTAAAAQIHAGLQKWVFNDATGNWQLAYTLTAGLNLGVPYTVHGYPTGNNAATGLPWSPATDGLRNITGKVNPDGTATIWAITSTVSGNGDQGADPNELVAITDTLSATALPATESFKTVRTAGFGEVLRGVSFTPRFRELSER